MQLSRSHVSSTAEVKTTFIKTIFIRKKFHQNPTFIKNHFHQKTTFIKKPLSSKANFIKDLSHQKHFHQNHSHQKPLSSQIPLKRDRTKHAWVPKTTSPCFCESVAGRRPATLSQKHGLCPLFGFQQAFMWSIADKVC